jgi:hypothetical protein
VLTDAVNAARRLNDGWIGSEHFLLALWAKPSIARDALEELGLTYEAALELVQQRRGASDDPPPTFEDRGGHLSPTPATYRLMGRAEAFAAAFGHERPKPQHLAHSDVV